MILFKDITIKNFLSIGNNTQATNFNCENLTLVLGKNLDIGGDDTGSKNAAGKCVGINTIVKVKNTITGEIYNVTIGKLYNSHNNYY